MSRWKRFNELVAADLMDMKPPVSPHMTSAYGAILGALYFAFDISQDWLVGYFVPFRLAAHMVIGSVVGHVGHAIVSAAIRSRKIETD